MFGRGVGGRGMTDDLFQWHPLPIIAIDHDQHTWLDFKFQYNNNSSVDWIRIMQHPPTVVKWRQFGGKSQKFQVESRIGDTDDEIRSFPGGCHRMNECLIVTEWDRSWEARFSSLVTHAGPRKKARTTQNPKIGIWGSPFWDFGPIHVPEGGQPGQGPSKGLQVCPCHRHPCPSKCNVALWLCKESPEHLLPVLLPH